MEEESVEHQYLYHENSIIWLNQLNDEENDIKNRIELQIDQLKAEQEEGGIISVEVHAKLIPLYKKKIELLKYENLRLTSILESQELMRQLKPRCNRLKLIYFRCADKITYWYEKFMAWI